MARVGNRGFFNYALDAEANEAVDCKPTLTRFESEQVLQNMRHKSNTLQAVAYRKKRLAKKRRRTAIKFK